MDDNTVAYRKAAFARYYDDPDLRLPPRFGRREFGFLFFDRDGMQRHTSFDRVDELTGFVQDKIPEHCYYSTAYYEQPDADTMDGKGWLGADLIFDLDADHLDAPDGTPYPVLLEMCRDEAVKLVEDFLMRDLGFEEDEMEFAFSGGRGYHVHVRDPRVLELASDARREIVDHIVGQGLDTSRFLVEKAIEEERFGNETRAVTTVEIPRPDDPGWAGRFARGFVDYLATLREMDREEALGELSGLPGVGTKSADQILEKIRRDDGRPALQRVREDGKIDLNQAFLRASDRIVEQASVDLEGETDEPVTTDTHRLIRLQGSLHGRSGLKVERLGLDELRDFDPLEEAVVFGDEPVRCEGLRDAKLGMKGQLHEIEEGETFELPECAAILGAGIHMVDILDEPRPP